MRSDRAAVAPQTVLPDAQLVYRIAALSDKRALAELHARHAMTLYALAYSLVFDGEAADAAVTAAFREVWRGAASFDPREHAVARWLGALARQASHDGVRAPSERVRAPLLA